MTRNAATRLPMSSKGSSPMKLEEMANALDLSGRHLEKFLGAR
jgi:hypothetical protein